MNIKEVKLGLLTCTIRRVFIIVPSSMVGTTRTVVYSDCLVPASLYLALVLLAELLIFSKLLNIFPAEVLYLLTVALDSNDSNLLHQLMQ